MQEWFDELKANYPYMANEIFDKGFNKYLEKEKEQIIEAHEEGFYSPPFRKSRSAEAEEYYNQTYNQNK